MKKSLVIVFMSASLVAVAHSQSITVLSPNGGERWNPGDRQFIRWQSSGISGNVKIEVLRKLRTSNFVVIGEIDQVDISLRSYSWRVGDYRGGSISGEALPNYRIRIKTLDARFSDDSDASFTIYRAGTAEAVPPSEEKIHGSLLPVLFTDMKIRLDNRESWLKYTPTGGSEKTKELDIGEFKAKGSAGVRDILHKIQDINSNYWNLSERAGRVFLLFRFETRDPIEIKRFAHDGTAWRDYLAYDINLLRFEFTISFEIGGDCVPLSIDNVIKSPDVAVTAEADISNAPDQWNEWVGINDKVRSQVRKEVLKAFSSSDLKASFYNTLNDYIKQKIGERSHLRCVFCSGDYIIIKYDPPRL
jgi:hypothetical protein